MRIVGTFWGLLKATRMLVHARVPGHCNHAIVVPMRLKILDQAGCLARVGRRFVHQEWLARVVQKPALAAQPLHAVIGGPTHKRPGTIEDAKFQPAGRVTVTQDDFGSGLVPEMLWLGVGWLDGGMVGWLDGWMVGWLDG